MLIDRATHEPNSAAVVTQDLPSITAPIGLFDSGVGGLSVYQHLERALPNENYIYYADTKHVPYGSRSADNIRKLTLVGIAWLVAKGCKIIVIACNSASAHALQTARLQYPHIQIVGLVPALKPAVLASYNHKVAVLATQATLDGDLLNEVIQNYANPNGVEVIKWYDPRLVPWVESGMPADSPTAIDLIGHLNELYKQGIDHLILGCTHYPFFRKFLEERILQQQQKLAIIDSGEAVAARVKSLLTTYSLQETLSSLDSKEIKLMSINDSSISHLNTPKLQFFATKFNSYFQNLVIGLTGSKNYNLVFIQ